MPKPTNHLTLIDQIITPRVLPPVQRNAIHPAKNAAVVGIAAVLAEIASTAIIAANPAFAPVKLLLIPAIAGFLGSAGSTARTAGGTWKLLFGWIG